MAKSGYITNTRPVVATQQVVSHSREHLRCCVPSNDESLVLRGLSCELLWFSPIPLDRLAAGTRVWMFHAESVVIMRPKHTASDHT